MTEEKRCPNCGNIELKKFEDNGMEYIHCSKCDKDLPLDEFVKRSDSEFVCDKCGASVLEIDYKCPNCGDILFEDEKNKEISKTGYYLMCLGATIYFILTIITFVYIPDTRDIQDYMNYSRLMTAITFMAIIAFMFGSIKQIKELM